MPTAWGRVTRTGVDVTSTNLPQLEAYTRIAQPADIDGSEHLGIYLGSIHFGPVLALVGPLGLDSDGALEDGALGGEVLGHSL